MRGSTVNRAPLKDSAVPRSTLVAVASISQIAPPTEPAIESAHCARRSAGDASRRRRSSLTSAASEESIAALKLARAAAPEVR